MIVSYKPPSNFWQTGPMYRGRENVTTLGNLMIRRSALSDTGNYTVRVDTGNGTQTATGWLEIQGELAGCPFPDLGALGVRSLGDHTVQLSSTCR